MLIKDKIKSKLPITDLSCLYVVADFDRTITKGSSKTSWSILANSDLVPEEYALERNALYEKYRPIEIDETKSKEYRSEMMNIWWQSHIELFVKYKLKESVFEKAATDLRVMEFRDGGKEFIEFLHEFNIPLIIISAGVGNFIETFLKVNGCFYDNVYVSSNKIIFKDGIAFGIEENIIHSFNKNEVSLPQDIKARLEGRKEVILLGDQVSDLLMVDNNKDVISVGFEIPDNSKNILKNYFDIVCESSDDYNSLKRVLFK